MLKNLAHYHSLLEPRNFNNHRCGRTLWPSVSRGCPLSGHYYLELVPAHLESFDVFFSGGSPIALFHSRKGHYESEKRTGDNTPTHNHLKTKERKRDAENTPTAAHCFTLSKSELLYLALKAQVSSLCLPPVFLSQVHIHHSSPWKHFHRHMLTPRHLLILLSFQFNSAIEHFT